MTRLYSGSSSTPAADLHLSGCGKAAARRSFCLAQVISRMRECGLVVHRVISRQSGRKKPRRSSPGLRSNHADYFDWRIGVKLRRGRVPTELKVVLRLPPTVVTAVMMTTEMRAAIRPYSIAVAPDSSRRNFFNI